MLISHRRHHPSFLSSPIELDRAFSASLVLRRVQSRGVVQDDRFMPRPKSERQRCHLHVNLAGRGVAFVQGRSHELGPGDVLVVPQLADFRSRAESGHCVEVDWEPGTEGCRALGVGLERGRLGPAALRAVICLDAALEHSRAGAPKALANAATDAFAALAAEGLPLTPAALTSFDEPSSDQPVCDAIDATLSNLEAIPAMVELEQRLGATRRTVLRRLQAMQQRYRMLSMGSDWRSERDFYRRLVGCLYMSHPRATTRQVAALLGYGSADAFCHSMALAGLPSPSGIRSAL